MDFGERLRRLRTVQGLSVRELARRVGVSGSHISQLESNECRPSFSVLKRIAEVTGTPVSALIEDSVPDEWVVVRKDSRRRLATGDPMAEVDLAAFTGSRDRRMTCCFITLRPGFDGPLEVFTHERDDLLLVLDGTLAARSGGREYVLGPGDVAYFGWNKLESLRNSGPKDARVFWVASPSR